MYKFKFFQGYTDELDLQLEFNHIGGEIRRLRATWEPMATLDLNRHHGIDVVEELTNELSQQISENIDNEIVNELARRINSGEPSIFEGPIDRLNHNYDYLTRWLDIGGNNRA